MVTMRRVFFCVLLLKAAVGVLAQDPDPCENKPDSTICNDCQSMLVCEGGATDSTRVCDAGYACTQAGSESFCVAEEMSGQCYCSGKSQCDPYVDDTVMLCDPSGGLLLALSCDDGQECYEGECVPEGEVPTPPPSPCDADNANSWAAIYPSCTSYAFCTIDETTAIKYDCPAGSYYDEVNVKDCTPAPPNPCTGCEGTCSDPYDCSTFHTCQGGQVISSYVCNDAAHKFDYKVKECAANGECDPRIDCDFGLKGTTAIVDAPVVATSFPASYRTEDIVH